MTIYAVVQKAAKHAICLIVQGLALGIKKVPTGSALKVMSSKKMLCCFALSLHFGNELVQYL